MFIVTSAAATAAAVVVVFDVAVAVAIIVPYRGIDSMLYFRFMESVTRRCNKINK